MSYNLTYVASVNNSLQFVQRVNTELMGGWYGVLILIVMGIIVFIAFVFSTRQPIKSFTAASFISFGFALLLSIVGLVPPLTVFITLIATALGVAFWNMD